METFSRDQQIVVLLIIFGMSLLYFHSINQPPAISGQQPGVMLRQAQHERESARPEPVEGRFSGAQLLTLNKPLNINTATAGDLEAIPWIGLKTAEKIVAYRKKHGKFAKIEDIMKVPGIKGKRFEKIKKYLMVK